MPFTIPLLARQDFLRDLLPVGPTLYIALFQSLPDNDGLGGVEVSAGAYARVEEDNWTSAIFESVALRLNRSNLVFPVVDIEYTAQGWGVYDLAVAGTLLAFGPLRTALDGTVLVTTFPVGDNPRISVGNLQIGFS